MYVISKALQKQTPVIPPVGSTISYLQQDPENFKLLKIEFKQPLICGWVLLHWLNSCNYLYFFLVGSPFNYFRFKKGNIEIIQFFLWDHNIYPFQE